MKVTDITQDNAEYFAELVPEGALEDENTFWLGAVAEGGAACAVLGAGVYEDTACIDWIFTHPDYRRQGAARALLKWLKTLLRKIDVKVLEISFSREGDVLEEFLEAEGFFFDEDREIYSVPFKDIIYSELIDLTWEKYRTDCRVVTLKDFGRYDEFFEYLQKDGVPVRSDIEGGDLSLIRLGSKGEINGCMLLYVREDGDVEIAYLKTGGFTDGGIDIFLGLKELAIKMNWREESLVFSDRSETTVKVIEELTKEDRDSYIVAGMKTGMITL